jgi:hypothetical protein
MKKFLFGLALSLCLCAGNALIAPNAQAQFTTTSTFTPPGAGTTITDGRTFFGTSSTRTSTSTTKITYTGTGSAPNYSRTFSYQLSANSAGYGASNQSSATSTVVVQSTTPTGPANTFSVTSTGGVTTPGSSIPLGSVTITYTAGGTFPATITVTRTASASGLNQASASTFASS